MYLVVYDLAAYVFIEFVFFGGYASTPSIPCMPHAPDDNGYIKYKRIAEALAWFREKLSRFGIDALMLLVSVTSVRDSSAN